MRNSPPTCRQFTICSSVTIWTERREVLSGARQPGDLRRSRTSTLCIVPSRLGRPLTFGLPCRPSFPRQARSERAGTFQGDSQGLVAGDLLSSCRLYRRSFMMPPARPRPNVASMRAKFLLAKSGVDDQVHSNVTAASPNAAALTTTSIFQILTCSRNSLTGSTLRMPFPYCLESAFPFRS